MTFLAALLPLFLSSPAQAELSPGDRDVGFKTYEISKVDQPNKTLGFAVVIGKEDVIQTLSTSRDTVTWAKDTTYWFWLSTENATTCDLDYDGKSWPGGGFDLTPRYHASGTTVGTSPTDWNIGGSKLVGCTIDTSGVVLADAASLGTTAVHKSVTVNASENALFKVDRVNVSDPPYGWVKAPLPGDGPWKCGESSAAPVLLKFYLHAPANGTQNVPPLFDAQIGVPLKVRPVSNPGTVWVYDAADQSGGCTG